MRKINLILLLILILILINTYMIQAQDEVVLENLDESLIEINADNIILHDKNEEIIASGNAKFTSNDFTIAADRITFIYANMHLIAYGKPLLLNYRGSELEGSKLELDLGNKIANIYNARYELDSVSFTGGKIDYRTDIEPNLIIDQASYTTCIMDKPHYHYEAESIEVYPKEKIVAKKVSFWWGNNLILNLPSYTMIFEQDEEGKTSLSNTFPISRFGYNGLDGLIYELNYLYEINKTNFGSIYLLKESGNEFETNVEYIHDLDDKSGIVLNYGNERYYDDDDVINNDEYAKIGYLNQKDEHFSYGLYYRADRKHEPYYEDSTSFVTELSYKNYKLNADAEIQYNFNTEVRKEDLNLRYKTINNINISSKTELINEKIDAKNLNINQNINSFSWDLLYKDGYSIDYKPYGLISYDITKAINVSFGYGYLIEDNIDQHKIDGWLKIKDDFEVSKNINFRVNQEIKYVKYLENNTELTNYDTKLVLDFKKEFSEVFNLRQAFGLGSIYQEGIPLFEVDEIDKDTYIESKSELDLYYPKDKENWILGFDIQYSLLNEKINEMIVSLGHEYDCYGYSINYNFDNKAIGFEFSFKN